MNICTKEIDGWLKENPKAKEWLWFIALWLGGLLTVMAITYPIKLLIKLAQ